MGKKREVVCEVLGSLIHSHWDWNTLENKCCSSFCFHSYSQNSIWFLTGINFQQKLTVRRINDEWGRQDEELECKSKRKLTRPVNIYKCILTKIWHPDSFTLSVFLEKWHLQGIINGRLPCPHLNPVSRHCSGEPAQPDAQPLFPVWLLCGQCD